MHPDLKVGQKFPNFELPDQDGEPRQLSKLIRGFPTVLIFNRGYYWPKDRRQLTAYVRELQPEFQVNYCKMITVTVDDRMNTNEVRAALAADWPFLMDPDRSLLHKLQMTDQTDQVHGEVYIPYTFILDRDRTIYKIYNGWWFIGRPTCEEIRMDLRALMSKRPDWIYSDKKQVWDITDLPSGHLTDKCT